MLDTRIDHARIIDGSGAPSARGSVGIRDGLLVTEPGSEPAAETIDASGLCLAPGFIDAHSHGDMILGSRDAAMFKVSQGVTTEAAGQCGTSAAPVCPEHLKDARDLFLNAAGILSEDMKNWTSFERYLQYAEEQPKALNTMMYVGHSTLRIAVMGMDDRPPAAKELDAMKGLLREAMQSGAAGFSTGLIYTPCCYAGADEIVELAKVIAPYGGIYASHMRNESSAVAGAVRETIDVGRKAGVRVDISHHKMLGRPNWGKQKETLRLIHEARDEGIFAFCDQYPYTRNMTTLNACMPPQFFDEGCGRAAERLGDPSVRKELRAEMESPDTPYDNYYLNAGGWDGVLITAAAATPGAEGKTVSEYAAEAGLDPWTAYFDLQQENRCVVTGVFSAMCDEDVCEIYCDPCCVVGSDGINRYGSASGHPRACGTFPHTITRFVREKRLVSLEEAVHKMTGLTADCLQIRNKGLIRNGYDADLVLFDFDRLRDTASYLNPNGLTEGISRVFVGGQTVWRGTQPTGLCPGRMILH